MVLFVVINVFVVRVVVRFVGCVDLVQNPCRYNTFTIHLLICMVLIYILKYERGFFHHFLRAVFITNVPQTAFIDMFVTRLCMVMP
jgi:hypothetical protein